MPEWKLVPKNIESVGGITFTVNGDQVTGFTPTYSVNYGQQGITVAEDIWQELNENQRARVQEIYDAILAWGNNKVANSQ